MLEDRLLGLLGIGRRAGTLVLGSTQCLNGIRKENLHLVLLDGSTKDNTRKAIADACRTHHVPLIELRGSDVLGDSIGRPEIKVVGVLDERFARAVVDRCEMEPEVKALEQN